MLGKIARRGRALSVFMLCVAVIISFLPWSSGMSGYAFAGDTPETVEEAKAALDAAEAAKDQAAKEKTEAETAYEKAKTKAAEADAEVEAAEKTLNETKEQQKLAATDAEQKQNAKEEAEQILEKAQNDYKSALSELESQKQAVADAEKTLKEAKAEEASKKTQWENEQQQAQSALTKAQEDFDKVGIRFLNEKAGSSLTDEVWFKWLQTNMAGVTSVDTARNESLAWNTVLTTDTFKGGFYSPYSYDNLMQAADLVEEGNKLRKSQNASLSDLKISYKIMTQAIASNALSCHWVGHVLMKDSPFKSDTLYATCGKAGWENIAWGAPDPFMGWYYEEKIHYLADQKGKQQANITEAMVDQIVTEAQKNGHDFLTYCKRYGMGSTAAAVASTMNEDRPSGNYSTGHYTNLINANHQSTGLSVNAKGSLYRGICQVQAFNQSAISDSVTPAQFKAALESYSKSVKDALDAAEAKVTELQSEPVYYASAVQARADAETALNNARTAKAKAEQTLEEKESAQRDAQTDLDKKTAAYDQAETVKNNADQAVTTAEATYNQAKTKAEEAANEEGTAEEKKNEKMQAWQTAEETYQAAQAAYDDFFKLENAVIAPIPDQTYTGEAIEPALTIKDKGKTVTLKAGTDYTVSFKNNTNAGEAALTIEGKGIYSGSQQMTFQIQPKEITGDMVGDIPDQTYTGKAIVPQIAVTFNGSALTAGTDYNVLFESNINAGEATVTISGTGNYTGNVSTTFDIARKVIDDNSITVDPIPDQQLEKGKSVYEPEVVVKDGGATLTCEQDYKLAYENCTEEGTSTVTISGQGNYDGTREVQFQIVDPVKLEVKKQLEEKITELESLNLKDYSAEDQKKIRQAISDAREMLAKPASEISIDEFEGALSGLKTAKTNADTNLEKAKQQKNKVAAPKKPAKVTLTKVKKGKGKLTIQWKRVASNTTGYQIQLKDKKSGQVKLVSVKQAKGKKIKKVVKGLKHKTKYTVMVRACNQSGKLISWGPWSKAKTGKVK